MSQFPFPLRHNENNRRAERMPTYQNASFRLKFLTQHTKFA